MKNGIYSAAGGMLTAAERLNVIANNMANVNTAGFKGDIPFEQVIRFYDKTPFPGKDQPVLGGTSVDTSSGSIRNTGRNLDLAIQGEGFFAIQQQDGSELYTRNGEFSLNSKRELVTSDGRPVLDKFDKKIQLFGDKFYFTPKGDVIVDGNYFATLKIVKPTDYKGLEKVGDHFFKFTGQNNKAELLNNPAVVPQSLESANVQIIKELGNMITAQRSFEFQQKTLSLVINDLMKKTISDLPKPV